MVLDTIKERQLPRSKLNKLAKICFDVIHGITRLGTMVSIALILALSLFIIANVIGRFVFNRPITGDVEIVEITMVVAIFLGMGICIAEKRDIIIDVVIVHISKASRAIVGSITSFLSLIFVGLLIWRLGVRGWKLIANPLLSTPTLDIPLGPFLLVAAIGCFIMWLELAFRFADYFTQAIGKKSSVRS